MLSLLLVGVVVAAPAPAAEKSKDADVLQDTWEVMEFVVNGKALSDKERAGLTITIKGDRLSLVGGPEERLFRFRLDGAKQPRAIDIEVLEGVHKGKTGQGIYQLTGDTLQLVLPNGESKERPGEFKSPEGKNLALFTLKRKKQ